MYIVAVIDESQVTRLGLETLINELVDFEITFSSSNAKELIPILWKQEMVLYSFSRYDDNKLKEIASLQDKDITKPIIVYCPNLTTTEQLSLVGAGVKAIISYPLDENILANVLRCAAYGAVHFSSKILDELKNVSLKPLRTSLVKAAFSELKLKILALMAEGYASHQIAALVNRSRDTIEWNKRDMRIMAKVRSTPELLLFAHAHGLIETPSPQKGTKKGLNHKVGFSETKHS